MSKCRYLSVENTTAVILAGGMGTRVSAIHPTVPKPMIRFDGEPFLAFLVDYLRTQGVARILISTGHLATVIEDYFRGHPDVTCIREASPLGTGGALKRVADTLSQNGPLLALNGDSFTPFHLPALLEALDEQADIALATVRTEDASRYGRLELNADGYLSRFLEKEAEPRAGLINAGVYLFRMPQLLDIGESQVLSLEKEMFPTWLSRGVKIATVRVDGPFLDIGTPDSLKLATEFLRGCRQLMGGRQA